jgi:hypothetical protein
MRKFQGLIKMKSRSLLDNQDKAYQDTKKVLTSPEVASNNNTLCLLQAGTHDYFSVMGALQLIQCGNSVTEKTQIAVSTTSAERLLADHDHSALFTMLAACCSKNSIIHPVVYHNDD